MRLVLEVAQYALSKGQHEVWKLLFSVVFRCDYHGSQLKCPKIQGRPILNSCISIMSSCYTQYVTVRKSFVWSWLRSIE